MSCWSVIGLADRNALENLMLMFEELKNENQEIRSENRKLFEENRMLMFEQMQSQHQQIMQGQRIAVSDIRQDIYENHSMDRQEFQLFEGEFKKLKTGQDTFRSALVEQGDSIQNAVAHAEESAGNYYDGLTAGIGLLKKGQERITSEVGEQGSGIQKAVEAAAKRQESTVLKAFENTAEKQQVIVRKAFDNAVSEQRTAIWNVNKEISKCLEETEKKVVDAVSSGGREFSSYLEKMEKSHEVTLRKMSEQFEIAIREFRDTRNHYQNMVHSEDQWLERLEKLSNDFVALLREQSKAIEYLSQICQESDQFMEIQKSINDMWEIMKVVWVDSLLDGLEK